MMPVVVLPFTVGGNDKAQDLSVCSTIPSNAC